MKPWNENPVIIAGGGIGGLAAALALARKGFRSVVLEQAPQFGEIGAGIQIAPNAWHALDALGVGALVKKEAVFVEHLFMRSEEHTSELQSQSNLVCRLLLEKKKQKAR